MFKARLSELMEAKDEAPGVFAATVIELIVAISLPVWFVVGVVRIQPPNGTATVLITGIAIGCLFVTWLIVIRGPVLERLAPDDFDGEFEQE